MPSPWAWLAAAFVSFMVFMACAIYWSRNKVEGDDQTTMVKAAKIGMYLLFPSTIVFAGGFWWAYKGQARVEAETAAGFPPIDDPDSPGGRLEVAHQQLLKAMATLNTQKATLQERATAIKATEATAANLKAKGVID
jgi:cbb3-type cytochrome oxidase subunit 3